jgi:hypothetical protein
MGPKLPNDPHGYGKPPQADINAALGLADVAAAMRFEETVRAAGAYMYVDTDDRLKIRYHGRFDLTHFEHNLRKYNAALKWFLRARALPGINDDPIP